MNSQITNQINQAGHLTIGGVDSLKLAKEYGTPLVVYDVSQIRNQIRAFKKVFEEEQVNYAVSYASKAFASIAMYQVANEEGAYTDVVSAGELYTAMKANFPMERISFHGNNKSKEELEMAVKNHVGKIMIDNFYEIDLLRQVLEEQDSEINVMLRITPGISAHTHQYDQTGQVDSKFGFDLKSGQADKALQEVLKNQRMHMLGIHAHIGSQIFELNGFEMAAAKLVDVAASWRKNYDYTAQVINVGGGFGIKYVQEDHPLKPEEFVKAIVKTIKDEATKHNFPLPEIDIEPGRSIVGPAGYNLYKVGSMKEIPGLVPYVAVDGGMGDNIRPALYQAKYETVLANDPQRKASQEFHVAGKYCESGDILADAKLPLLKAGDILAMLDTGAYGYSMASNYNRNPRPAVVFAEDGKAQVVIRRESLEDLVHLDQDYNI
ncbi:diaminopimelate decarboxylase [Lactobacillus johnsonii]|jgi:diaminopimelate decarboxylase|uniref:Diaminopimelate decarboxylase n=1 Tax=Lactobacillus johnsonii TaxID=33959 RepID=A0A9X8VPU3_LACJH|nr:diaminopimelate decarboxylase [Lactobacillus johnsonii]AZZ67626.1 diaminopimelate decarboxylase [Lactobacillus johnsonii]MCI6762187.1 diaminopimelate decarboxylase [Lactobacillus johnsonii]MCI6883190.1 diaminopimelate decarboxylase [Lactobacillus johnsonii]MDD7007085.1 diaminopimelate decarboxylase [Lactobacillus johnsonii]MDY4500990.1 diaminopimelate decarboxylase [Lactobacillus johnsonii]